jgi:hypothetical protein
MRDDVVLIAVSIVPIVGGGHLQGRYVEQDPL